MIEFLRAAQRAGITVPDALTMTPYLLGEMLEADAEGLLAERRWGAQMAWQAAALTRAKRLPPLREMLAPLDATKKKKAAVAPPSDAARALTDRMRDRLFAGAKRRGVGAHG